MCNFLVCSAVFCQIARLDLCEDLPLYFLLYLQCNANTCLASKVVKPNLLVTRFIILQYFANFDDGSFEKLCDHQIGYKFKAVINLDSSTKSHHRFLHVSLFNVIVWGTTPNCF